MFRRGGGETYYDIKFNATYKHGISYKVRFIPIVSGVGHPLDLQNELLSSDKTTGHITNP